MSTDLKKIVDAINPHIGLEMSDVELGEDELYRAIQQRVAELLEQDPALLFSYLYRLDVLEKDLKMVLSKQYSKNPIDSISDLILQRQKDRIRTKEKYRQEPIEGWEW